MNITALFSLFLLAVLPNNDGEITVTVTNIRNTQGQIIVALFDSKEAFLKTPFQSKKLSADSKIHQLVFDNLPVGNYAVSIIHDENMNEELDTNMLGIPKEGFGFSKKSFGTFGPPGYNDTKVEVNNDEVEITIPLKYFL